jgi:hypothetical protein
MKRFQFSPRALPIAMVLVSIALVVLVVSSFGWPSKPIPVTESVDKPVELTVGTENEPRVIAANKAQEGEIRQLVEQLVFADQDATDQPVINPEISEDSEDYPEDSEDYPEDSEDYPEDSEDYPEDSEDYRKRFETCQKAFQKLSEFKSLGFPVLIEHLDDKRQSINFRNHHLGNSVGDACYWNIYFQLQDRPQDYSEYGYSRKGRDGKDHPKPYWQGTPFGKADGLRKWLKVNKDLTYLEMQIKCLKWLLDKEKQIGASDADSYFVNILPLEIQILKRRKENGENVELELRHHQKVRDEKLVAEIPQELLPGH